MTPTRSSKPEAALETLANFLRHLGWSKALDKAPHPLSAGRAGPAAPPWLVLFANDPEAPTLAVLAPVEGRLTPLRRLYTQFEDMGSEVRRLLSWWRENPFRPDYLLLTDGSQTLLYDTETEESLASAEERADISESVLPHLAFREVARGSLKDFPRRTADDFGKELGAWVGHWTATIGSALGLDRVLALGLVEAVLLARLAERLGYAPGRQRLGGWASMVKERWRTSGGKEGGSRASGRTARIASGASAAGGAGGGGGVKILRRYWHALEAAGFLPARLTERQLGGLAEQLASTDLLDRWLASLSRLSWRRFQADVFAVALADEELRHKSWATMVTGPPAPPGDLQTLEDLSLWLHAAWELELDQVGYGPVLRALDMAVAGLKEYNLTQRAVTMRGDRTHLQLELFEAPPEGLTATLGLSDPVGYALGHVLRVRTRSTERARLMRFVLTARALELNEASAPVLNPLPDLRKSVYELS